MGGSFPPFNGTFTYFYRLLTRINGYANDFSFGYGLSESEVLNILQSWFELLVPKRLLGLTYILANIDQGEVHAMDNEYQ